MDQRGRQDTVTIVLDRVSRQIVSYYGLDSIHGIFIIVSKIIINFHIVCSLHVYHHFKDKKI